MILAPYTFSMAKSNEYRYYLKLIRKVEETGSIDKDKKRKQGWYA
jgi:hypothetical protein